MRGAKLGVGLSTLEPSRTKGVETKRSERTVEIRWVWGELDMGV